MTALRSRARSDAASVVLDRQRMGERLRALRKSSGLTLKALSAQSGVALSTLSKMELGQISASYEKMNAVARTLGVDLSMLFAPAQEAAVWRGSKPVAVKSTVADAPRHDSPQYLYRLLAGEFPGKRMRPIHGTILARSLDEFPAYVHHTGQEFIAVLSGRLRICFETGETLELRRGESAYFDSGVGHVYLSIGRTDAQALSVMCEG